MPKYLTVREYLAADEALPILDSATPQLIAEYIRRAEVAIDNFLYLDPRVGGFEPHTVWHQSKFDVETRRTRIPTFPIPLRKVTRYSVQIANQSTPSSGQGFFVEIGAGDIASNVFDGYVEILPLQAITYSMVPVLGPFGLKPPVVQMEYTTGYYLPIFGEVLTDSGDHKTYEATRGFWASTYDVMPSIMPKFATMPAPANIYVNNTLKTVNTDYTLNVTEGTVTFAVALLATDTVTADYVYQIPDNVREATTLQTSYLLAMRQLNQYGMQGLQRLVSDGTMLYAPLKDSTNRGLCEDAAYKLAIYEGPAIG